MLCNTLQVQFYSQLNIEANVFIGQSTSSPGKGIDSKGKIQFRDNYVYTPSRLVTLISNLASHIVQKYLSKCAFHLAVTGSNPKHTIYAFLIYGLFYHIRHCNQKKTKRNKKGGRVWPIFSKCKKLILRKCLHSLFDILIKFNVEFWRSPPFRHFSQTKIFFIRPTLKQNYFHASSILHSPLQPFHGLFLIYIWLLSQLCHPFIVKLTQEHCIIGVTIFITSFSHSFQVLFITIKKYFVFRN